MRIHDIVDKKSKTQRMSLLESIQQIKGLIVKM